LLIIVNSLFKMDIMSENLIPSINRNRIILRLEKLFNKFFCAGIIIFSVVTYPQSNKCESLNYIFIYLYVLIEYVFIVFIICLIIIIIKCGFLLGCFNINNIIRIITDIPVRLGASDDELNKLQVIKYEITSEDNLCSICLDMFKQNDNIIKLNCNHHYHKECCFKWFKINKSCPICRQEVNF
jgi:hypothetical protein